MRKFLLHFKRSLVVLAAFTVSISSVHAQDASAVSFSMLPESTAASIAMLPESSAASIAMLPQASVVNFSFLPETALNVPNLVTVSPSILRGGQPTDEGFNALKQSGIRTIINLRGKGPAANDEEKLAEEMGFNYVSIPMSHFKKPSEKQINKFLSVLEDESNLPAFIHCHQGQDRTGTMVAIYKIKHMGWTAGQSYKEMLKHGFRPFFINLTSGVYNFAKNLGRPEEKPDLGHIVDYFKDKLALVDFGD